MPFSFFLFFLLISGRTSSTHSIRNEFTVIPLSAWLPPPVYKSAPSCFSALRSRLVQGRSGESPKRRGMCAALLRACSCVPCPIDDRAELLLIGPETGKKRACTRNSRPRITRHSPSKHDGAAPLGTPLQRSPQRWRSFIRRSVHSFLLPAQERR